MAQKLFGVALLQCNRCLFSFMAEIFSENKTENTRRLELLQQNGPMLDGYIV